VLSASVPDTMPPSRSSRIVAATGVCRSLLSLRLLGVTRGGCADQQCVAPVWNRTQGAVLHVPGRFAREVEESEPAHVRNGTVGAGEPTAE